MRRRTLPQTFICKGCDQVITLAPPPTYDTRTQYCSLACKMKAWWRTHPKKVYPHLPATLNRKAEIRKARAEARHREKEQQQISRQAAVRASMLVMKCRVCGTDIPPADKGRRSTHCSDKCWRLSPSVQKSKRVSKAARKARMRGNKTERLDPYAVFRRDRWRCQLCGVRTPGTLRGRMVDRAPELDHIVPLSRGGSHTWDNVQCTCRKCNGQKGATVKGQLRLIGWSKNAASC